jgi:hypothetical protein
VFLAKIIARITRSSSFILNEYSGFDTARANPIRAKGMANTVWLNFTRAK